jgi:hypothetical protein
MGLAVLLHLYRRAVVPLRSFRTTREALPQSRFARLMRQTSNLASSVQGQSALRGLADLFPNATPLRMPILVSVIRGKGGPIEESATIEFGTSRIVFFESRIGLELSDKLHLKNSDGSLETEAVVVAVRANDGRRAVAARFVDEVRNWIVQG